MTFEGFCLFSGLPKAISVVQRQKTPPVETLWKENKHTSQKPRQHGDMKQFPRPVPFLPPAVHRIHRNSSAISPLDRGGDSSGYADPTHFKSRKALVSPERHHSFIFPGK